MASWGTTGAFWLNTGACFSGERLHDSRNQAADDRRTRRWLAGRDTGSALVIGGLSAVGARPYSFGIPEDSILKYETALKTDKFVLIVHGSVA